MTATDRRESPKLNALSFVTGQEGYVDDLKPDGLLHMAVARSTQAHARINRVDTAPAASMPGVVRVLDGGQAAGYLGSIPPAWDPETIGGQRIRTDALAVDKVRYVGEPIAVVVAESRYKARAAAVAITVEYEATTAVTSAEAAVAPGCPLLYEDEDWRTNVVAEHHFTHGDATAAFAAASLSLTETFTMQRSTTAPLEPRGYVASWDKDTSKLVLHASHQQPFQLRWQLSQTLDLPEESIQVVVPSVGGSFGLKMAGQPEESLVCLMSQLCHRPVKWIESREECSLGGGREQTHRVEVAFDHDGEVSAIRDEILIPVGAVSASPGWRMGYVSAAMFPTAYRIDNVDVHSCIVTTNEPPWHSCRGWGKDAPILVMERVMDLVARRLGIDPAEVRRRNLLRRDEFPRRMPSGYIIDSGDYPEVLDKTLSARKVQGAASRNRPGGRPRTPWRE